MVTGNSIPVGSENPCMNFGFVCIFCKSTYGSISTKNSPPAAQIIKLISLFSIILFSSSALSFAGALRILYELNIFFDNTTL